MEQGQWAALRSNRVVVCRCGAPSRAQPASFPVPACSGRQSGSTCSLEGHQVRRVTPGSGSNLYSDRLSFYCWSGLALSYTDSLQTSPQASAESGTGSTMKGLVGPGGQLLGMHLGSAVSTSLLGPHRHSKWNQTLLCKMELRRTRVMTATNSSSISREPHGGRSDITPAVCSPIFACQLWSHTHTYMCICVYVQEGPAGDGGPSGCVIKRPARTAQ